MIKIIDFIFEEGRNSNDGEEFAFLHQNFKIEKLNCIQANIMINEFFDWRSEKITVNDIINNFDLTRFVNLFELFPELSEMKNFYIIMLSDKYKQVLLVLICLTFADLVVYKPTLMSETKEKFKNRFKALKIVETKYLVMASIFKEDNPFNE